MTLKKQGRNFNFCNVLRNLARLPPSELIHPLNNSITQDLLSPQMFTLCFALCSWSRREEIAITELCSKNQNKHKIEAIRHLIPAFQSDICVLVLHSFYFLG